MNWTIYILRTKKNTNRVRPGKVAVDALDTITWINQIPNQDYVTITFNRGDPFVANSFPAGGVQVGENTPSTTYVIRPGIAPNSNFAYTVTAADNTDVPEDSSSPEIDVP